MYEINISPNPDLLELRRWILSVEQRAIGDLRPFWDKWASKVVIEEIARIFVTQGYGRWAPLSERYALWKSRHYPGKTILRREDNYFRAATKKGGAGNVFVSTEDKMVWGVDLGYFATTFGFPYPIVHESEERGKSTAPRRPVFQTAAESENMGNLLVMALKDYLTKVVQRETKRYFY